jgi:ribosomal protein S27E
MFIHCPHCRNAVCTDCYSQMNNKCPFCRGPYVASVGREAAAANELLEFISEADLHRLRPRYYTQQDIEDAVRLAHAIGVRAASEELDIPEFLIYSWIG